MVKNKKDICPYCGGELQSRGKVKRILKIENGKKIFIYICRFSCRNCKRWHRVLPNNVVPYKHYRKDIYEGFKNGTLSSDILEFEDMPTECTQKRWKRS